MAKTNIKTNMIYIRMTDEEKQRVYDQAEKEHLTVSAWIRATLLKEIDNRGRHK